MAAEDFFEISWGSVRLFCSEVQGDGSRDLVIHDLSEGGEHPISDRGPGQRPTRCMLLFDEFPGEAQTSLDRFLAFKRQVDSDEAHLFTHPVDGPYFAKVGEFTYTIDEDSNITGATAVFYADAPITAALAPGLGSVPSLGLDAVAARADELNTLLEDSPEVTADLEALGIDPTFITDAAALPEAWLDAETVPTREILVDVARVQDQIDTLLSLLETDLALYEVYRAAILFGAAFRAAAIAATSETPSVFTYRIGTPTSVLALVTRVYGGEDAEDRERQVRSLNDIRTPGGLLAAGTELVMPTVKRAA